MNNFVYNVPTKVYFGRDQLDSLPCELSKFGNKVLLTYGGGSIKKSGLYDRVVSLLKGAGIEVFELNGIDPNPRVTSVREGARICKENNIDAILAVGGGSVIDCSKYIAAATFYDGDAWDISLGKVDVKKALPLVTILTLSATGSEMNAGGVISNLETNDKLGRLFAPMLPRVSYLDPTNTFTVSPFQTACGSVDIFSHIIEVYFNKDNDMYMLDTVMEGLMKTVVKYAPIAMNEPDNYEARANLMWTSSWAINTFVKGGKDTTWICHPIEHELSAYYDITHGLGLAIVTPRWMRYVLSDATVDKFYNFAVNVFGVKTCKKSKMAVALEGIERVEEFFFKTLGLKSNLSSLGIDDKHIKTMAEKACVNGDTLNGFVPLNSEDIEKILTNCLN